MNFKLIIFQLMMLVTPIISQYLLLSTTEVFTQRRLSLRRKISMTLIIYCFFTLASFSMSSPTTSGILSFSLNSLTALLIVASFSPRKMSPPDRYQLIISASLSIVLYYFISYVGDVFCYLIGSGSDSVILFLSLAQPFTAVGQFLLIKLFIYKNPYNLLQKLTTNLVVECLTGLVILLNFVMVAYTQMLTFTFIRNLVAKGLTVLILNELYSLILILLADILLSGVLVGISSYILFQIKQRKLQENIVLQQNYYIQNLEKIQRDMRVMRHDYKNVLAGLFIHAQEGDVEGVKEFLQSTVTRFDEQIGKNLQQSTHLSKVELIELKGLLLTKLVEMEKLNIDCSLEIINPVKTIKMETTDLLRCVGILLDNATEELSSSLTKKLKVVISQEEHDVSILVKNPVRQAPLVQQIWKEGYSTKGTERGLGLFSYQRIVDKYPNVLKETTCENQQFTQILKIRNST